jgi:hypothetical protein
LFAAGKLPWVCEQDETLFYPNGVAPAHPADATPLG